MRSQLALALGLLLLLPGCAELNTALAQAAAPPVFVESFEAPVSSNYTVVRAGQSFATHDNTWRVTAGSVDIVNTTVRRETAPYDGVQVIDLAGSPGAGVMSTSFATTPGQRYTLAFSYGRNNGIGATAALARVDVIGAGRLLRADLKHAAPTPFNLAQRFRMAFVADSAATTLRFTSLTGGNAGVTIDAISVVAAAAAAAPAAQS